jgi:hypothetical protein
MDRIEKNHVRDKIKILVVLYSKHKKVIFRVTMVGTSVCLSVEFSVIHGNFRKSAPIRFFFLYKIEWNKMIFIYTAPRN